MLSVAVFAIKYLGFGKLKSSSGQYFQSLDHVRAIAVFTVFVWHFIHFDNGQLASPLVFPFSFFTEGHTGVAIFMTLSGYLFAKLLDGKRFNYFAFLRNRFLRLAPLLIVYIGFLAIVKLYKGQLGFDFVERIVAGILFPTLPGIGWSITVESHFYVILPLLLLLTRWSKISLLLFLILPILVRTVIHIYTGEVQSIAFWTILGRIDQFILGIFAFQNRNLFAQRNFLAFSIGIAFLFFWYFFDRNGGFYMSPAYFLLNKPSPSPIWIFLTTFEGVAYSALIAWYDNSFRHSGGRFSDFIAMIGTYSYSIYLLHFIFVFQIPVAIDQHLFDLSNPYLLIAMAIPSFLIMLPISYVSYRFIEQPFLRHRKKYLH